MNEEREYYSMLIEAKMENHNLDWRYLNYMINDLCELADWVSPENLGRSLKYLRKILTR